MEDVCVCESRETERVCDMNKPGVQCCSKSASPGWAKSRKMFGSPLAPSPRRRHSHHLKKRKKEKERGQREHSKTNSLQTIQERQQIEARG